MNAFKLNALALTVALALPAAALAQAFDTTGLREADDDNPSILYENSTVDQLEDMNVVRNGETIGEVEEVLVNDQDEVVALVIEHGGFLDIGDTESVVPVEMLTLTEGSNEIGVTLSDEELEALPEWDD